MRYKLAITLYIFILGLIPLLWFEDNKIITGTDINFSPFPIERLEERFYAWNDLLFSGTDKSINISSLPYVATSALGSLIFNDITLVQKFTFVFWLTLAGFSIAYLLDKLFADKDEHTLFLIKIFGILFYMVNFYHVFLWVRLQVNITTLIFFPILLAILHTILNKNTLRTSGLLLLSFATIAGGPIGKQPPIIYAMLITVFIYTIFYLSFDIRTANIHIFWEKSKKIFLTLIIMVASGAYWILPLGNYIFASNLIHGIETGVKEYNVKELLEWTSEPTNNLNLFRMYGDVVWYDSWGGQAYFPEFLEIYANPIFVTLSFVFVFIVFTALYTNKKNNKVIIVYGFITLISIFFSKGIHPPFSGIFEWAFNNIPAFWIHRAPWQKFGLIATIGYTVLGAYGAYFITTTLNRKLKIPLFISVFAIIALYIIANNLFVLGKMFPSKDAPEGYHGKFGLGFHHTFPDYLYESREYIDNLEKDNYNILLLPQQHTNIYDWGYAGATDITWIFLRRSILSSQFGEGFVLDGYMNNIYNSIVNALYANNLQNPAEIFEFYNIAFILQRNDFRYNFYGDYDSPNFVKNKIQNLGYDITETFGKWGFYATGKNDKYPIIHTASNFVDVNHLTDNILLPIMLNPFENVVLIEGSGEDISLNGRYLSSSGTDGKYTFYSVDPANYQLLIMDSSYNYLDSENYTISFDSKNSNTPDTYTLIVDGPNSEPINLINLAYIDINQFFADIGTERGHDLTKGMNLTDVIKYTFETKNYRSEYLLELVYNSTSRIGIAIGGESTFTNNSVHIFHSDILDETDTSKNYKHNLSLPNGLDILHIYLYPLDDTKIDIESLTVTRLYNPNIILKASNLDEPHNYQPTINFKKLDSTKYLINIDKTTIPKDKFAIVFNQTFSPHWKLYKGSGERNNSRFQPFETIFMEAISNNKHYKANFFSNVWVIDPTEIKDTDYLIIEFNSQRLFYTALIFTMATPLGLTSLVILRKVRRRKHENS